MPDFPTEGETSYGIVLDLLIDPAPEYQGNRRFNQTHCLSYCVTCIRRYLHAFVLFRPDESEVCLWGVVPWVKRL